MRLQRAVVLMRVDGIKVIGVCCVRVYAYVCRWGAWLFIVRILTLLFFRDVRLVNVLCVFVNACLLCVRSLCLLIVCWIRMSSIVSVMVLHLCEHVMSVYSDMFLLCVAPPHVRVLAVCGDYALCHEPQLFAFICVLLC